MEEMSCEEWERAMEELEKASKRNIAEIMEHIGDADAFVLRDEEKIRGAVIAPCPRCKGKVTISYFDSNGFSSHNDLASVEEAVKEAVNVYDMPIRDDIF